MLYYDRINVSKGNDVNKTYESHKCIIDFYYFLKVNLLFHPNVCDGCRDLMQKYMAFNDVEIVNVTVVIAGYVFGYMSKDEAINIMKNSDFKRKK